MTNIFRVFSAISGWTGRLVLKPLLYIVDLSVFSLLALRDWKKNNSLFRRESYRNIVSQIIFTGIDALPAITFLALIAGFLFTFRLIALVDSVGGADDLVDILVNVIGLEIGSLIAALILVSRTGSAIVVDIGNMKLHGEIEGLEFLAININDYLITPRLLSCAISQLVLTVYFTSITMLGGILLSSIVLSAGHIQLLTLLLTAVNTDMLAAFIIKNLLFGFIIGAAACYHGLNVAKSPTEVPQQTQQAIVNSLVMIFVLDGLMGIALLT
ncbi:MAG: ABC transporter permease [gamma proteobacterium symbiont of Taylorina sp.]|nr:ABC transporter permease [gamma proteobacterium symbiont of Taylorina sp.]